MPVKKQLIIDVDKIIENYNTKNPTLKPMTRTVLAEKLGMHRTTFTEWKKGYRLPNIIQKMFELMEIGDCDVKDFIIEKEVKDE